jgi:hypothetical protein
MKQTHKEELWTQLLEWLPELLLLITDIFILAGAGEVEKVAGAGVAALALGAVGRLVRAPSGVAKKLAEADTARAAELLSSNYYWPLYGTALYGAVWAVAGGLEDIVGLPGMADYIMYAAPASLLIRVGVVGYMALGTAQVRVKARIRLAWVVAVSNVALTYWLVVGERMGAEGASLGTLLAELVPTAIVLWWAHRDGLLERPQLGVLREVWRNARVKTLSELPAIVGTVAAIALNGWLGEELARQWTFAQTCVDVVGGLAMMAWGVSGKHFTYNLADAAKRADVWRYGDRIALSVMALGAVASLWVAPCAPLLLLAWGASKRREFLCDRWASKRGFDAQGAAKLAYTVGSIVGYTILVVCAEPSLWAAVAVFCCAQAGKYYAAHAVNG